MIPSDNQPFSIQSNEALPMWPEEAALDAAYGAEKTRDGADAQARQFSLLVEVNAALAGVLDVESALGPILSRLAEREGLSYVRIFRLHDSGGELQEVARGGSAGPDRNVISIQDHALLAWTVREGKAAYVPRVGEDSRCQGLGVEGGSAYAVPLQTSTRILGVMEAAADRVDGIRPVTRTLIQQVATQAALAMERAELYRQLRVSEERFVSIFEQIHIGIALATLDGRYATVNPAFAGLLGNTCQELEGKLIAEITHSQDAAELRERLQTLLKAGERHVTLEARYLRKSGESLWCATDFSLLHDAAGHPSYFLAMVQDIDMRRRAEEENSRLKQQLFQSQKMEALGTLAGGIAHDFNNLLSVMLGFASLARQRLSAEDPLQDTLGMIEQSAHRAAELTRQLLGFARPERQQMKPVSVGDVLDRVRRMVASTFDRNITVAVRMKSEPLWVKAEPSYLEQALLNMCINARDSMPQGGTLTLEAAATSIEQLQPGLPGTSAPGSYASISVQDTGVGIAPETLPWIFDPFFTTKEPGRGTGLGLAMVFGFAKSHEGFVKVESESGRGAKFTISLPLVSAPDAQTEDGMLGQIQQGRGTVLVVDDEPLVRAFAAEGLKALGYQVWVAENGKQALQIYEEHRGKIDYVLLDLVMPELGGLETFRRMRAFNPLVRAVFASGYSNGGILRDAPDAHSASFLGKPFTLEGLSIALRKAGMDQLRSG